MKFKKIVGFGDSWMYGDELLDPVLAATEPDAHFCWEQNTEYRESNCFLGQLAKHYNVPYENFGIPGGSLTSTQWTFQWWLDHEQIPLNECLVLVALTNADRLSFYNPDHIHYSNDPLWNKFIHSSWVEYGASVVPEEWRQMVKQQLVLSSCLDFNRLNYHNAVMFFDGIAARNNIPLFQFNIMPAERGIQQVPTLIWPDFAWTMWFRNHPGNQNRELIKPCGHPNETGHSLIKDRLISHIDSCILYEC